jgi:methionyl-tRNA formyltransferase
MSLGIEVAQPATSQQIGPLLEARGPFDVGVLVAFGMLIRPEALAVPGHGILNAHFSLLPRWRGAAPVQRAMMAGDERTGVSIMALDPGLDTGPVVAVWSTAIGPDESGGTLSQRLGIGAARLLAEVLDPFVLGRVVATSQPGGATVASKLSADERPIDWSWTAGRIVRHVMALSPRPGATASYGDRRLRIVEVSAALAGDLGPGQFALRGSRLYVGTGEGSVELVVVHPAGKSEMSAVDWCRGLGVDQGALT